MKTVRMDAPLEAKLNEAMELTGLPASQIIRDALEAHCERLFGQRLDRHLAGFVGMVEGDPTMRPARDAKNVFAEAMEETRARQKAASSSEVKGR